MTMAGFMNRIHHVTVVAVYAPPLSTDASTKYEAPKKDEKRDNQDSGRDILMTGEDRNAGVGA